MTAIQAVFFDAGGTLLHPVAPAQVYGEVGRRFGSRQSEEQLQQRFGHAFRRQQDSDRANGWVTGEGRERERWQAIVAEVLEDVIDQDACFDELYRFYADARGWLLEPDAAELLRFLDDRGLKVGLASNYDKRLRGLVQALPELSVCRCVVISAEVGWCKPAPQFFDALQRAAGCPAEAILMVGDDLDSDYQAALAAGMQAVLYDPHGRHQGAKRVGRLGEIASRGNAALIPGLEVGGGM